MRDDCELEDLISSWTLDEADWRLLSNKAGATRLGFALLLKFFEVEARFPRELAELPAAVVGYVGRQVKVDPAELPGYDPGRASLNTILEELEKLERVRSIGLPADLLDDCSERLIAAWRARASALYPSDLRAMPGPVRLTLLAVLCWSRSSEITDSLVDLLIEVVHKIRTRAENRVEGELVRDLKRVRGKQGLLFALAEAAVEHPDHTVRAALFPVVSEATLRELVREAKANELVFQQRVRKVIRGSYSNHYRRMLPRLIEALEFRCSNTAYRPVMDALELLQRHLDAPGQQRCYHAGELVPIAGVVPEEWREAVVDELGRVERVPYELCVLRALREAIRRREIYVVGARRWRDADEDPPSSSATATCTTRRSASPLTRRRSWPTSKTASGKGSTDSSMRSALAAPAGCGSPPGTASRGSWSRRSTACPTRRT